MATPVVQSTNSLGGADRTTAQVPVPSGVANNDIVIVGLYRETAAVLTPAAGFTSKQIVSCTGAQFHEQEILWKRSTGGDTGTYDFSWAGTAWSGAWVIRVSGCNTTGDPFGTPINTATSNSVGSSTATPAVATLTPDQNDCLVLFSGTNYNSGAWTPPTGFTERVDFNDGITCATLSQTTATATGSVSATATGNEVGRTGLVAYLRSPLSASVTGTSTASAIVTGLRTDFGSVTGTSTASATVTAQRFEIGSVTGVVTADATVEAEETPPLDAGLVGEAFASAEIRAVTGFYFRTPTVKERPRVRHGLLSRTYLDRGITILKFGSSYQQHTNPDPTLITTADVVYIGGHLYFIQPEEAFALMAAGYGIWVTDDPNDPLPDVDYSAFGAGFYGEGTYGD